VNIESREGRKRLSVVPMGLTKEGGVVPSVKYLFSAKGVVPRQPGASPQDSGRIREQALKARLKAPVGR